LKQQNYASIGPKVNKPIERLGCSGVGFDLTIEPEGLHRDVQEFSWLPVLWGRFTAWKERSVHPILVGTFEASLFPSLVALWLYFDYIF